MLALMWSFCVANSARTEGDGQEHGEDTYTGPTTNDKNRVC
jgi:hypothetical protein